MFSKPQQDTRSACANFTAAAKNEIQSGTLLNRLTKKGCEMLVIVPSI